MKVVPVALSEIDRSLLDRCLSRKARAWEDFVDRFMGLVVHVINHTAQCRSINLSAADRIGVDLGGGEGGIRTHVGFHT